jgi:fucose 4-O-acetylase-like acetyltransferase
LNNVSWKLSLSRIIAFFPYFILGYFYKDINVKFVIKNKWIAIFIVVSISILIIIFGEDLDVSWLYCAIPYKSLKFVGIVGTMYRLVLYLVQLLMLFSFMRLVPKEKNIFNEIGKRTLSIYIFHGFIVKLFVSLNYYQNINKFKIVILLPVTILVVLFFSQIEIKSEGS